MRSAKADKKLVARAQNWEVYEEDDWVGFVGLPTDAKSVEGDSQR
jgi:hypothetical protein